MSPKFIVASAASLLCGAASAAFVSNASFENPGNTWTNTAANYMAVATGSSAINGWAVVNAGGTGVAWAKAPTGESYPAAHGTYFVDLSGFGTQAGPNARLEQTLQNLIAGETYTLSLSYWGDRATLSIDGLQIGAAGLSSNGWSSFSANFQATGSQALLSVGYIGTSGVAFVDNFRISGPEAGVAVPLPGTLPLMLGALGLLGLVRRRQTA